MSTTRRAAFHYTLLILKNEWLSLEQHQHEEMVKRLNQRNLLLRDGCIIGAFVGGAAGFIAGMSLLSAINASLTPPNLRRLSDSTWTDLLNFNQGSDLIMPAVLALLAGVFGAVIGRWVAARSRR
jgi:hypothetical protein